MSRRRSVLVGTAVLVVVILAGGAWLVAQALAGVDAAEAERHRQIAERVFDEVEGELSALVEREEGRSFLEYRYFYVPEDNANQAVVQSPLSRPSQDPVVVGWWSLEPDGTLRTPAEPRGNELSLAEQQGWSGEGSGTGAEIRRLLTRLPPAGTLLARTAQAEAAQADPGWLLNRGVQKRQQRTNKVVATKLGNLDAYRNADQALLEPQADAGQDVNVEVRPFQGYREGDRLVLHRVVMADGEAWRQGLVVRIPELERQLATTVLGGSDLESFVSLAWDGGAEDERRWRVPHRFAEPFQGMSVVAGVDPVPALVGSGGTTIRAMAVLLVVALVGGGLLIARTLHTELEFAQRRSDFVAAVSHELKTPLTTIRMYAEMLRDGMIPDPERQRWYHQTITSESDRLGRLIGNVLELARLERGGPGPELVVVGDPAALLEEALQVVRPHANAAGFALEVEAAPGLPPVRVDRDGLVQVVVNLVDNAVKFAAEGDRVVRCSLCATEAGVVLAVRDHGPGVPARQLGKVFEPFFRGERELVRRTKGTGIGLALVRGLVERMGGTVTARNHPAGGFEVELLLPTAV